LPRIGQVNYAAAKAGLNAMTQALSKEVARMGITVNAIMPGFIETEALSSLPEDAKALAKKDIPMRRFGKASEVAAAVRFLASDDAAYITGAILKIDGGIF
jgi:3-oxoacyl-[acyl-carrier protein] reductase